MSEMLDHADRFLRACQQRQILAATAESCTGGMLGGLLTARGGASDFFAGGVISYSNEVKRALLGVEETVLRRCGAVSEETASLMAENARRIFGTDLAVAVTGIAGPSGGTADKPVGTFYVGHASAKGVCAFHFLHSGPRDRVRRYAAYRALDVIRRRILGLAIRT